MNRDEQDRSELSAPARGAPEPLSAPESDRPSGTPALTKDSEFRAIYDAHFPLVWRALSRLGVREADLMDLTQKVFLTAHLKLPEFEGRSLMSTWLWGICRRVASGYRRSAVVQHEVPMDPSTLDVFAEKQGAASLERESAQQVTIDNILAKMSEPQRVVFLLFEVDEMDGRDIAALLDIPLGTVRSRLRYARLLFRREVQRLAIAKAFPTREKR